MNCDEEGGDGLHYYVYAVFVNTDIKYIGMGKNQRYAHTISGASHVKELNRDFYAGKQVVVRVLDEELTEEDAAQIESDYIRYYLNNGHKLYNSRNPKKSVVYEEELPTCFSRSYCSVQEQSDMGITFDVSDIKKREWDKSLLAMERLGTINIWRPDETN